MGFWDNSLRIFKGLCDNAQHSVRHVAQRTALATSRVHRLTQALARRNHSPESWLGEMEEGRRGLTRLVVATL
jgi:IclR helix-turn-helix domain